MAEISLKDALHSVDETNKKTIELDIQYTLFQQLINFICQQTPLSARKISNKGVLPRNYQKNHINTKKFTLFDFIPKFLMHELQISINIVYIFFVVFNFIFQLDGSGFINFYSLHLITSLTLSFLRELYFLMRSAYSDYQYNSVKITKITKYGQKYIKRCNVKVGDIIELNENQLAPADLLILKNNNEDNLLWVKTDQLDGNLNSQLKDPIKCINNVYNFEEFFEQKYEFMIEKPNAEINKFNGEVCFDNQKKNLTVDNCIWKNCYLTSGKIYGLVIYTGKETKSSFCQKQKIQKIAEIDTKLTYIYIIQLACFTLVSFMGVFVFQKPVNNFFRNLNANFVYYGIFISIAPKILLDWTRFALAIRMNKINKKENLIVNNIEIIESIGSIDTMLIDKTGTLTKNNFNLNKLYSLVQERNLHNNHFTFENEMQKLFLKIKKQRQLTEDERIDFMQILGSLLCTEIYTKHLQDGTIVYNGVSQEEIAIVNFLQQFGIILKKRCKKLIEIELPFNQLYKYEIQKLYPLKKFQTHMGIIVKCLDTQKQYLFIKGNEDSIVPRISNQQEQNWLIDNMKFMRQEGLRPLSLIYKEIKNINSINFQNDDFQILTIFGVEDRFQYKVQESLQNLKKANIKTYLVTGDEIETIKSITNFIKFKEKQKQFFILNDEELYHLQLKLEHYNERVHLMIITGSSFELILQANHLKKMFLDKIQNSFDVCFCKFSANQKEILCKLLKNQGQNVCAIGDGSNDIPMILQANVGIGISGEQGSEASQQADFSIKQFSDLQNLVLHKGRNYNMIVSKNVTFAHWSLVYAGLSLWFFNIYTGIGFYKLFTNLCLFTCTYFYINGNLSIVFTFEDMSLVDVLDYPNIYIYSQQGSYLNLKVILKWLFKMIFQNLVVHTLLFWFNFSLNERRFVIFTVMMIEGYFVLVPSLFSFRKAYRYFIFDMSLLLVVMMTLKDGLYFGPMQIELLGIALAFNLASNLPFLLLKIYQDYLRPSNERKIILECQKRKKLRQTNEKFTVQDF